MTTIQRIPYTDTTHNDEARWTDGVLATVLTLAITLVVLFLMLEG